MAEVNLTLGDPIEVKVTPAEGATNVSVASAPQNVVQVQAAIATNGLQGADGAGVPTDPPGAAGQALVKKSAVANDTEWAYIDKLHINVRNKTGATIPAGSVVYASGLQGNDILIDLADASDASKMPAIGFTYEDIGDNNKGDVISAGVLVKNITVDDAGTADVGDTMYVSPATPGGITTVRPSDAAHKVQNVGIALKVTGNNNQVTKFKVSAIDRVNDVPNLEDGHFFLGGAPGRISEYQLPTGSPTNGQLLKANADGNLVFVNASDVTKNIGTVDLTTTNTTRNLDIIEDGHLNIRDAQNDPILYIDEATKRVGINTTTLDKDAALFINGDVLFKNGSTIGVEGGQSFTIGKIGSNAASANVNVTGDLSVSGNCTIDTNLKFGTGGNQLHANTNNTFEFGKNGSGSANYKFNSDVGTVTFDNTTDVQLKNAGGLKIFNSSNSVSIQSPSLASSYTLTLPNSSGTDGYVLKTDGSGTTSWVDVTAVSDAILDADFSDADSGLMKKTGDGTYAIATADTDYQSVLSDGPFETGDKDKLDYITVGAAIDLGDAVLTTDTDVSGASFVVDEDDMSSDLDTKVPTQQSVKAYVDSHVKTAIYSDASDNPQLAAGITAGEVRTLIGAIDDYTVTQGDVTAHQAALSIATTQLTGLSATGNVSGVTLNQVDGAFTLGGSVSITESQISDLGTYLTGSSSTNDLSDVSAAGTQNGGLLIYNSSSNSYVHNTLTASTGISIDSAAGNITISATADDVTLASVTDNYLSLSGQEITAGTVPLSLGGTGASSAAGARTALSLEDSDIIGKFSGGTGITLAADGTISSDITQTSTTDDLDDVSAGGSAHGQILIYNNTDSHYEPSTITAGDNITVTNTAGRITIDSTATEGLTYTPLATLSGRFQWSSTDDNRTILCGNTSYGTNYYLWSTKIFNTVNSGTVDTTTQSISNTYGGVSFKMNERKKIRWDWQHRPINSSGYSKNYRAQIWSSSTLGTGIGGLNWTLRADEAFTSNSTTGGWLRSSVTTTSQIQPGHYVMFVVALDQSVSATTYLAFQSQTYLQE